MGLFGIGKKKNLPKYEYRMLFMAPINDERDQQIKGLVLKYLSDAGVVVNNVKTTLNGYYGSVADYMGQNGELISIECARTPMSEEDSSYIAITVNSNICSKESANKAFSEIKSAVMRAGYYFTEF